MGVVVPAIDPKAGAVILASRGPWLDRGLPASSLPKRRVGVDNALGLCGWVAMKNQCHHSVANLASQRASASPIGTPSITAR